jgi:hypothetical protein
MELIPPAAFRPFPPERSPWPGNGELCYFICRRLASVHRRGERPRSLAKLLGQA